MVTAVLRSTSDRITFAAVFSISRISSVEKSSICKKWCPTAGGEMFFPLYVPSMARVTMPRLDRGGVARTDRLWGRNRPERCERQPITADGAFMTTVNINSESM